MQELLQVDDQFKENKRHCHPILQVFSKDSNLKLN